MKGLVTVSCLGKKGRWGNQVFQYCFARSYAQRYGINYQVNPWIGQKLCDISDSPITEQLPTYKERATLAGGLRKNPENNKAAWTHVTPPDSYEAVGKDFDGYAQFHTSYYHRHVNMLRRIFQPNAETQYHLEPIQKHLAQKTVIGIHLRRGDTGRAIFYLTPNEWYLQWLEKNWSRFENPQLVIATEEPPDVEAFAKYSPVVASELVEKSEKRYDLYNYLRCDLQDPTAESMDWFPDWFMLTQCDVLLFGESTFGFSAAMMNPRLTECWRSRLSTQSFELIDPWDSYPLVREHLDDYPNIPGTFYTENPKWKGGEVIPA